MSCVDVSMRIITHVYSYSTNLIICYNKVAEECSFQDILF